MGSSSSKAAQGAARRFPTRAPGAALPASARQRPPPAPPGAGAELKASTSKTKENNIPDAPSTDITADFSRRLREMGIVKPQPTYSPTSRVNLHPSSSSSTSQTTPPAPPAPPQQQQRQQQGRDDPPAPHILDAPTRGTGRAAPPVYPSPSSNPTLAALEARRALQGRADAEFDMMGRRGSPGREFLDLNTIVQMHFLREKGVPDREIERRFDLREGVVGRLGPRGVTRPVVAGQG
ncbi:hypothetical protein SODALDRAFT_335420 [Sodiomyces alkalinus F11]|uniref:Helix-turn-helix domain-containing protein n=1 Tax=Sodiomyces alkalinus (strain CBS 110278 / VKM F-3762 / F11) TaxID=1314773 RepID=A0A3N2PP87_SODAK|nr:hypothetical protein SODALDRAFT_335420 [Sodiomyces alkalinus F11]ROT36319.1 hypothetical protein SODALDRAFT_335420 [Sodiomyces alkalinus F11]